MAIRRFYVGKRLFAEPLHRAASSRSGCRQLGSSCQKRIFSEVAEPVAGLVPGGDACLRMRSSSTVAF